MFPLLSPFVSSLPRLTWVAALDIVLVSIIIYQFIQIVRGRRAAHMLGGLLVLVLVYLMALALKMELLRTLLATLAPYTAFAMIVMFQSEIRRLLARLGKQRLIGFGSRLQRRDTVDEILLALQQLAQQKIGGLIVVEREIGLRTFVESGVPLDAAISRDLLLALFHPGAAMHDGAVIIQGDRIAAAACFLPLTMNPELLRYLGTRHRAAIGVTEETDCLSLIVSEETGRISIAQYGEIEYDVTLERVEEALTKRERPALKRAFGVAEERQA
ncbi:MAG: TIGR00159 family protein [Acidobacteriia bacterium 12-62-4]|nr:MAG: TIGR00159 family protein [Acidobacteriia bacterium 12-62-4]